MLISQFKNFIKSITGGPRRDRTDDLNTASVALSQLSYGPTIGIGYINFQKLYKFLAELDVRASATPNCIYVKENFSPTLVCCRLGE